MKQTFYIHISDPVQYHVTTRELAKVRIKNYKGKTIKKGEYYFRHQAFFDTDQWTGEPGIWNVHFDGCDYRCKGIEECKKKLLELYCGDWDDATKKCAHVTESEATWVETEEPFEWT